MFLKIFYNTNLKQTLNVNIEIHFIHYLLICYICLIFVYYSYNIHNYLTESCVITNVTNNFFYALKDIMLLNMLACYLMLNR